MNNLGYNEDKKFDVIFADYVYEQTNFDWIDKFWDFFLKPNGVLIAMTDFHSSHNYRFYMDNMIKGTFVNHLVWKNEWGNHPKNRFHQCYDDIIIYSNGNDWKFYSEKIQVDKVTKAKGLNPSGRTTKTATAWIDDIALTTTSNERVKKEDGHLVRWQKPMKLYDRIIAPFTDENSNVMDLFMGSGSLGKWCKNSGLDYVGIELDEEVYKLAIKNIGG